MKLIQNLYLELSQHIRVFRYVHSIFIFQVNIILIIYQHLLELMTWYAFMFIVQNGLQFHKAENYVDLINDMLIVYQKQDARCFLKFISYILIQIFFQDISEMESKYQVWFIPAILGVYCRKPVQYARVSASVSNNFKMSKEFYMYYYHQNS